MHSNQPWPERDDELRFWHSQGNLTWSGIAEVMHLNAESVKKHGHRLGLDNTAVKGLVSRYRNWPMADYRDGRGNLLPGTPTLPPLPSLMMPMPECCD
jgi:hypothetical protein